MINVLIHEMTDEAFDRWTQHLHSFKLEDSLCCDSLLEDPSCYAGGVVDWPMVAPDANEHLLDPSEDKFKIDWGLPMKRAYMKDFADELCK